MHIITKFTLFACKNQMDTNKCHKFQLHFTNWQQKVFHAILLPSDPITNNRYQRHHKFNNMKFLFDLFPVLLFFISYKFLGIFAATWVAIAASIGQILWLTLRKQKIDGMMWMSAGIIIILGSATLISHNETFIKWKLTILYWLYALLLIGSEMLMGKNLLRGLLGKQMSLPDTIWRRLNWSWTTFFALMGLLNLYVAYTFSTNVWVNFKLFGSMGIMLLFVLAQGVVLNKYLEPESHD